VFELHRGFELQGLDPVSWAELDDRPRDQSGQRQERLAGRLKVRTSSANCTVVATRGPWRYRRLTEPSQSRGWLRHRRQSTADCRHSARRAAAIVCGTSLLRTAHSLQQGDVPRRVRARTFSFRIPRIRPIRISCVCRPAWKRWEHSSSRIDDLRPVAADQTR